jgi:hypothetical protein
VSNDIIDMTTKPLAPTVLEPRIDQARTLIDEAIQMVKAEDQNLLLLEVLALARQKLGG